MRSPATGFFLANFFLDFSAEEFRLCSLRDPRWERGGGNSDAGS